jgi:UDP-glucose 4-epimerase
MKLIEPIDNNLCLKDVNIAITGGAGFIGRSLAEVLISSGANVIAIDNLSSGKLENIAHMLDHPNFFFVKADLKDLPDCSDIFDDCEAVFHLAANADVRIGSSDTNLDFDNNLLATRNLLEEIRKSRSCTKIIFTSTSTVYGEAKQVPTPEDYGKMMPISLYGASKLACESLISGYSHLFGFKSAILRLANIVGPFSHHGIIFDFLKKLRLDPYRLEVLGDGKQNKSYLYISDCIRAILLVYRYLDNNDSSNNNIEVFNIGSEDNVDVFTIIDIIAKEFGFKDVEIDCSRELNDGRGWLGDVKYMLLDTSKIKALGWIAEQNSEEAIRRTVREILASQTETQMKTQKHIERIIP